MAAMQLPCIPPMGSKLLFAEEYRNIARSVPVPAPKQDTRNPLRKSGNKKREVTVCLALCPIFIIYALLGLYAYLKIKLEGIRRNTYHLRAYFSRLLVLGFVMDMVLAATDAPQQAITDPGNNNKPWVIGGVITAAVLLLAIFNLLVWYVCFRKRRLHSVYEGGPTYTRYFSFSEIENATTNFDEARVIGRGGFGKVYFGRLNDGTTVAIKRGSRRYGQGEKEFRAEIAMLSSLRHCHLISLLGCCSEKSEMILVYEYIDNGTLRQHLYETENSQPANRPLTLTQRLKIATHAATGLHYLHTGFQRPIIHRDVKSSNILLDSNFIAKVSDFGLSRERPAVDDAQLSSDVKGSFGYLDPEYYRRHRLTEKSDVFSFGVVLFEILFARPALDTARPTEQQLLSDWGLHCYRNNILDQNIDPYLKGKFVPECLEIYVQTAVSCVADMGKDRPSMGDVLVRLQHALALQESGDVFLQMPPEL